MIKHYKFLILLIFLSLQSVVYSQLSDTCLVSGTIYKSDGSIYEGARFIISRVTKSGNLIYLGKPSEYYSDTSGVVSFKVVQGAVAYIEGPVGGFNTAGGVAVTIPSALTATLTSLQSLASVTTAGFTAEYNDSTFASKMGTIDFSKAFRLTDSPTSELNVMLRSGSNSFTTTATADTVVVSGSTGSSVFVVSINDATPVANDLLSWTATTDTLFVYRPVGTTSGLNYSWLRAK